MTTTGASEPTELAVPSETVDMLLAAALAAAETHGLQRLSMADVAKRAGVSRQTLYRHFGSKETLVRAVVLAETARIVGDVRAEAARHADPASALEGALTVALTATGHHVLLDRLGQTEPEIVLPLILDAGGVIAEYAKVILSEIIADDPRGPLLRDFADDGSAAAIDRFCDLLARTIVSFVVSPSPEPPESVAAYLTHTLLFGALPTLSLEGAIP